MKSPIVKLGIAAAIIALVGLGIVEFIGTGSNSGVVWAEVAQRVEASPGVIFRVRKTGSGDPNDGWPNGHIVIRRSAALSRTDWYRGDQIRRTVYFDLNAKTKTWVAHDANVYIKEAMGEKEVQDMQAAKDRWTDPQGLVSLCVAREHRELGEKTIDGVLCEGIEMTDPSGLFNFPVKSFAGRLWVSVETGYPVLVESEVTGGDDGDIHHSSTGDQFQWNVDLSESEIEPEIPSDYSLME